MKPKKIYLFCEQCNDPIEYISPPNKINYEKGMIFLSESSTMLLPEAIAKRSKHKNHAVSIEGYYCNFKCLKLKIEGRTK